MGIHDSLTANNNFVVSLNLMVFSFSKVTNLSGKIELETVQEGGYNDSPRFFVAPKKSVDTLILEKGVQSSALDQTLRVGMPIHAGIIMVMDHGSVRKSYSFDYGIITKWETNELDAMQSQVFLRKVEISHTGLIEIL